MFATGSQVTVVSDMFNLEKQIRQQAGTLANQKVIVQEGDTTDRAAAGEAGRCPITTM